MFKGCRIRLERNRRIGCHGERPSRFEVSRYGDEGVSMGVVERRSITGIWSEPHSGPGERW